MSTTIFPFRFSEARDAGGYEETLVDVDDFMRSRGGRAAVLARASKPLFRAAGAIRFPQKRGSTTLQTGDLWDFRSTMSGRVTTFLYMAEHAKHREVSGASLGTGDASTTAFAFSDAGLHKYIASADFTFGVTSETDAETLKVYIDGVLKTGGGTDYTLSGNGTDPTVTFNAAPGGSAAITVSYLYYRSVRFAEPAMPNKTLRRNTGDDLAEQEVTHFDVGLDEDRPGASHA